MNSAKKLMNQQGDQKKDKRKASAARNSSALSVGGSVDRKKIVLSAFCICLVVVLCVGVGIQQLKPKMALKINDTKISLDDMMYPIYEKESQYLMYNEMYQYYTGSSVWDATYMGEDRNVDSSLTNSEGLKQEIINSETEYEVLYREAVSAGYTLDDDDKAAIADEVSKELKGLSWGQRLKLNISKSKLTKRFEKRTLADRYKEDQQTSLNEGVDEDGAIKDISKADYRQYDVEYYSVSTTKTDDEGTTKDLSAKKKKELLQKLQAVEEKAADADDFADLIDEKEKDITYDEASFTEQDGWSLVTTKKLLKQIKEMKKGEISSIIQDEKSGNYVLVKMIDNNSSESYETACEEAITEAQNIAYDNWYESVKANYTIEQNDDIWDDIVIGTVTTDIVTVEDLEKMNEDSSDNASSDSASSAE